MRTRELGRDGYRVGDVGLGCWQFGGDFGDMDEATAMAIMAAAVKEGVTFFDTADVYGAGRSETWIGRFLKTCSTPITVASKFGRGPGVYPDHYSADALRRGVEQSLARLGLDRLDLLQLHCIPIAVLQDGEIFDGLRQLKQEGLIGAFGASVESVDEGILCLEQPGLLSLQVIFNVFRQKLVADLLPQAASHGVGLIVRLPLASGLLSGRFTRDTTFAATDHRNYNRDGQAFNVGETFAGLPFAAGVELVEQVRAVVPEGMSMIQLALRWILDHEAVSVIIPGASSPAQAISNARVSGLPPLPVELHQVLAELYRDRVHPHIRGPY